MLGTEESPNDFTPDLIAYIHALYAEILQTIILSGINHCMYLAGVKVGLKEERDILKKAAAYFAQQLP
jgi:hypothetical protein